MSERQHHSGCSEGNSLHCNILYILSLKVSKFCYFTAHRVSGECLFLKQVSTCFNPSLLNPPGSEAFAARGWFQQRHLFLCLTAVGLSDYFTLLSWSDQAVSLWLPAHWNQTELLLLPSCLQGISSGIVKRPRWWCCSVELAVVQKLKHCTSASCGVTGCILDSWVRRGPFPIKLIAVCKFGSVIAYSANHYGKSECPPPEIDDPFILRDSLHQMLPQMTWSIWNCSENFWQVFLWWMGQHCWDLL